MHACRCCWCKAQRYTKRETSVVGTVYLRTTASATPTREKLCQLCAYKRLCSNPVKSVFRRLKAPDYGLATVQHHAYNKKRLEPKHIAVRARMIPSCTALHRTRNLGGWDCPSADHCFCNPNKGKLCQLC